MSGPGLVRALGGVVVSALAFVLAFPPVSWAPLALVALGPLVWGLDRSTLGRAFALGWLHGMLFGLGVARWLATPLIAEYGVPPLPAWTVVTAVVAAYAVVHGAGIALGVTLAGRTGSALAPLAVAAAWALAEWVRGDVLGLPWLLAGHALARHPLWIQSAALGGTTLLSVLALLPGAGLGYAIVRRRVLPLATSALVVFAWVVPTAWWAPGGTPAPSESIEVLVVQASIPNEARFVPGSAWRNTQRHAALTRQAVGNVAPDLVVWSETSVDEDLRSGRLLELLHDLADEVGAPIVTGAPLEEGGARRNIVASVAPQRTNVARYAKQRLVPFSEYDPAWGRPLAGLLGPVTDGPGYVAGTEPFVFTDPVRFATPICFEITYVDLVRRFRSEGAELLVNLSNDAWFGRTGYAELHLRHAVLRAVELGVWVVRGANTGISALIDPAGRVVAERAPFEEGTLRGRVGTRARETFYARLGDGPVLMTLSLVLVAAAWRRPRSRRN